MSQRKPDQVTGPAHLFAATNYSISGIRRLWHETAFRHEVMGCTLGWAILSLAGSPIVALGLFAVLNLLLFGFEALNTAIEELVDHLAPEWAQFAKNAKDLGSAAVFSMLVANGGAFCVILAITLG